jgi:Fic family protein
LVAEVHPFVDGNGRTARIMMNAELVSVGQT